jgi:hypothetical protein
MKPLNAALAVVLLAVPTLPCTGFLVCGDGKILFGNNEDYWDTETQIWFVPAQGERHGVMYLGFSNGFPQGGMNDAGLAFDGFATAEKPLTGQKSKRAFPGNPISEAMETCTTVDEVVIFLEGFDLSAFMTRAMLFFADANGDSVIFEGDAFLRKEGSFQVVTNFYQSAHDDDIAQCPRFAAASEILANRKETSIELCARALSASAQRGRKVVSLYSNVFDLQARTAHIYLLYDFEETVVLDLDEELKKGARTLRLPELFPRSAAWEEYVERQKSPLEERVAKRRGPTLSTKALDSFAGEYEIEIQDKPFEIEVRRKGDTLVATSPLFERAGGKLVLYSATDTEFFMINDMGELSMTFAQDEQGAVSGFTLVAGPIEAEATRVRAK